MRSGKALWICQGPEAPVCDCTNRLMSYVIKQTTATVFEKGERGRPRENPRCWFKKECVNCVNETLTVSTVQCVHSRSAWWLAWFTCSVYMYFNQMLSAFVRTWMNGHFARIATCKISNKKYLMVWNHLKLISCWNTLIDAMKTGLDLNFLKKLNSRPTRNPRNKSTSFFEK